MPVFVGHAWVWGFRGLGCLHTQFCMCNIISLHKLLPIQIFKHYERHWFRFFFFFSFLHWVFVAVWAFSSCGEWGLLFRCGARAFHLRWGGFSCGRAQALGAQASVVTAHGLSSCCAWV